MTPVERIDGSSRENQERLYKGDSMILMGACRSRLCETIADAEADAENGKLDRAFVAACQQLSSASAIRSCEGDSDAKQFPVK